jgi:hypothetical protein
MRKRSSFNVTPGSHERDAGSVAIRYLPAILLLLLFAVNALALGIAV